jgi:hypothetical protein
MPRVTNCSRTKSCTSRIASAWLSSRQSDLDLARQLAFALRANAHLAGSHLVPQRLAIAPAVRCPHGQHDLGMHDAGLRQIILGASDLVIEQRRARAVGRRGDDATALTAADDLALEMVDRRYLCVSECLPRGDNVSPSA